MKISAVSVRRGVTFAMIYLIVVGFGLFSLSRLQLDLYPDISFPTVLVMTEYTGSSPEDIESLVTRPIEGAVSSVKGVEEVVTESKQGSSIVQVQFDWDEDMEQAETEVRRQLEFIEGFMPEDASDPLVFAFDPSMQPVVMMMITGPYPLDELRLIAEDEIAPRLERLDGIATAEVAGGLVREIQVVLDPKKLEAYGMDVNTIVGAVYRENSQEPGGAVQQGKLDFTIQTKGKYRSVDEVGEVLVGMKAGPLGAEPLRLKEVARIRDGFREEQRALEVDHEPSIWLFVRKQSGENTVKAAQSVIKALPVISRDIGADVDYKIMFDQSQFITSSLGNLSQTALVGVVISFLVLLLFLRSFRSAIIVATAIPVSVITTFFVMDQADMTLNIISLAGLALAVGMLVDNAIVVLENIFRLREEGLGAWEASIQGAGAVSTAVTASTLTTISVFVPILFVPGIAGVMFFDMAVTICFALAVSLGVALTFIPLLASRFLGDEYIKKLDPKNRRVRPFTWLRRRYGRALDWSLRHRWVVGATAVTVILATVGLAALLPTEFVSEGDDSFIYVQSEAPVGSNIDQAHEICDEVVSSIEEAVPPEDRKLVALDVGMGEGFAAIFSEGVHAGSIRVPLVPMGQRDKTKAEIEEDIRQRVKEVAGAKVVVKAPFDMMGGAGDLELIIRGHDLKTSRELGLDLKEKFLAMPEVSEAVYSMDDQKPEVSITFDRPKLASLGIPAASVGSAVSTAFMGRLAGRYSEGGDEYDIKVRFARAFREDVDQIRRMPVVSTSGSVIPLMNVARVEEGLGPVNITRRDQERVTTLAVELKDTYEVDGKTKRKDLGGFISTATDMLEKYPWPRGFTYSVGGSAEDFIKSFKYLGLAFAVSILLVFMVMASQFESLRQPFIIIVSVPLAVVGVVVMFTVTRATIDMTALIGVIMLVGIAVNNGIVMIDAANQLRREGHGRREAIAQASRLRLRPVLMTSLTTILAMTPLALGIGEGSSSWMGMAMSVIGGLVAATFLTLFVVPTMYTLFARKTLRNVPERTSGFETGSLPPASGSR
jgi:HAE1 family hydrophobic/amphiphilic exporter-1